MNDYEILDNLIKAEARETIETICGKPVVVLREKQVSGYTIEVRDIPTDSIVINLDDRYKCDRIFKGANNECKRADYIIINPRLKKIIIIELKSKSYRKTEVMQQMHGARCFMGFCQDIGATFWKKDEFLQNYEYRYVSLRDSKSPKRSTVSQPEDCHDTPENMLEFRFEDTLYYKHIAK